MTEQAHRVTHDTSGWANYLSPQNLISEARRLQVLTDLVCRYAPPGGSLLEVGFGSGCTAVLLANAGYQVTAIDVDAQVINSFRTRFGDFGSCVKVVQANTVNLPFHKGVRFDVIYHQGVLEHLEDSVIIQGLRQQALFGRIVIFDVPNARHLARSYGDERLLPQRHWLKLIKIAGLYCVERWGRMLRLPKWGSLLPHYLFVTQRPHFAVLGRWFGMNSLFVCKPSRDLGEDVFDYGV